MVWGTSSRIRAVKFTLYPADLFRSAESYGNPPDVTLFQFGKSPIRRVDERILREGSCPAGF